MARRDPLESVLRRTHAALLAGDLAALPALSAETGAALDGLGDDPAALSAIAGLARRNAACIEAAAAGLRAARARLDEIARQQTSMGYDDKGRRVDVGAPAELVRRV